MRGKIKAVFGERGDRIEKQKVYSNLKNTGNCLLFPGLTNNLEDVSI